MTKEKCASEVEGARNEIRGELTRSHSPLTDYALTVVGIAVAIALLLIEKNVWQDYLRAVQVGSSVYIVLTSVRIVQLHYRVATRMTNSDTRLLPLHIQLIALSYIVYVIGLTIQVYKLLGEPVEWNVLPLALVGNILGVAALGVIWKYELAKAKRAGAKF